ncbi:uncharacterized protein LOC135132724 [Zophobas morio]|uniref:uncharacterized protein LOC135132724 n=1 Tax=Zophobas morio TaxID=2755281 RepID=UPI003083CE83
MAFRHYDQDKNSTINTTLPKLEKLETDLSDSDDTFRNFESSCLRIGDELDEDAKSCVSCDSGFTFYSTYPHVARSGSNTSDGTFKSARNSLIKISSSTNTIVVV